MNKPIQESIKKIRNISKYHIKHRYDVDELIYLNNYVTKYDVEQPFFRNIDVIEETIEDLTNQPEWLQLTLHKLVVEFFDDNDWTMVDKRIDEIEDFTERFRVNMFMDRISDRAMTSRTRYKMAFNLLKNYE